MNSFDNSAQIPGITRIKLYVALLPRLCHSNNARDCKAHGIKEN